MNLFRDRLSKSGQYRMKRAVIVLQRRPEKCDIFQAVVTLQSGEKADVIASSLDGKLLLNTEVSVSIYPSNRLLCVAHLPSGFTEENFEDLVSTYGPVAKCYLMRDEFTGESKGYGFVEYCVNRDKSIPAQEELDWKIVDCSCLQCDFVSGLQSEYSQLNSRCLLVENLPKDYRDDGHLRDIFSLFEPPAYCRILVKNDTPLEVGIVEYADHQTAARTHYQLNLSTVKGSAIKTSFCLVGKTAIDIYSRFMCHMNSSSKGVNNHKPGLLPNPVVLNEIVLNSSFLKGLINRQPQFIPKLRHALKELQMYYCQQINGTQKQGLLGPAPSMLNPMIMVMDPNLQLGLATLIALQLLNQVGMTERSNNTSADVFNLLSLLEPSMNMNLNGSLGSKPSLLGDPVTAQARMLVQNLMSQLKFNTDGTSSGEEFASSWNHRQDLTERNFKHLNMCWLVSLGQIVSSLQQNLPQLSSATNAISQPQSRNSLLGDGSKYYSGMKPNMGVKTCPGDMQPTMKARFSHEQMFAANIAEDSKENLLRNLEMFGPHYSGSKTHVSEENFNNIANNNINKNISESHISNSAYSCNSLLGDYDYHTATVKYGQNMNISGVHESVPQKKALLPEPSLRATVHIGSAAGDSEQIPLRNVQKASPLLPSPFCVSSSKNSLVHNTNAHTAQPNQFCKQKPLLPDPCYSRSHQLKYPDEPTIFADQPTKLLRSPNSHSIFNNNILPHGFNHHIKQSSKFENFSKQRPLLPDPVLPALEGEPFSPVSGARKRIMGAVGMRTKGLLATPIGKKRSYSSLLPAPELSPVGNYVGQHSQGIGGHYAETYSAKRRRN